MRKLHLLISSALLIGSLSSCSKQNIDASSTYYDQNDADIKTYATTHSLSGTTTSSGLYYAITTANSAAKKATVGEEVEFTYKAYNLSGANVDSTVTGKPVYYPLGIQAILAGLEEGIALMHEGEKATFLIPSYLAYGSNALTNLPAYSVVRFDVQLNRSRSEDQQIDEYIANDTTLNKLPVEKTTSGLRYIPIVSKSGATVVSGKNMTIKYLGKTLRASSAFDSDQTGTFIAVLGQSKYIKGFEEGLAKMRVGEKATIIFPSSIGYSTSGVVNNNQYVITPYTPLRFDLEVISQ